MKEIVVHTFAVDAGVDDFVVYAAAPLYEWETSEAGQWVIGHAVEKPRWERAIDPNNYNYSFKVIAKLHPKDVTYFCLRWL